MVDYEALKDEILKDPRRLGYAGKTEAEVAELLNGVGAGGDAAARGPVPAHEVIAATVPSEWEGLAASAKQLYQTIVSAGEVDVSSSNVREAVAGMLGAGTVTRANLAKLGSRAASRAEALGLGRVAYWDVARAKALARAGAEPVPR